MKVILMGYMGSGKSTIGREFANTLDYHFIDLDEYITKAEEMTIPDIFSKKGEIYFRKKEHLYLKEVLNKKSNLIISLGGGAPCYGDNMNVINDHIDSVSFYFKGSIKTLAERLFAEKENRPLIRHLKTLEDLQEFIGKHLFERSHYYNQAHNVLDIDNKTKKDLVEELVFSLF